MRQSTVTVSVLSEQRLQCLRVSLDLSELHTESKCLAECGINSSTYTSVLQLIQFLVLPTQYARKLRQKGNKPCPLASTGIGDFQTQLTCPPSLEEAHCSSWHMCFNMGESH